MLDRFAICRRTAKHVHASDRKRVSNSFLVLFEFERKQMTTDACLAAGAVIQQRLTDDKAVGIEIQLPTKLDSYVVGQGRIGVVVASDIFGWKSPQLRSNCDALAEAGFAVVMPDFFRGNTVPRLADGSLDGAKMFDFMETHGNWSHSVKKDTDTAVAFLSALKVERFAFLGSCSFVAPHRIDTKTIIFL